MAEIHSNAGGSETLPTSHDGRPPLRLAIISTPRSGNTWVRALLASFYGLEELAVHTPEAIPWDSLPRRCVIQLHWYPEQSFIDSLERAEVRVLVLARHPLDVVISWLNYSYYVHLEKVCPGENSCEKCALLGVTPQSQALIDYASGKVGHWLLNHSPAWWNRSGVLHARYEDLVAEPEIALGRLLDEIGEQPLKPIAEVLEATSIHQMKPRLDAWVYHYWQGRPGLWRTLLTADVARAIAAARPEPFETLGYTCDPDESLSDVEADLNWLRLQLHSTRENLTVASAKHRKRTEELRFERESRINVEERLVYVQTILDQTHQALLAESNSLAEARGKFPRGEEPFRINRMGLSDTLGQRWFRPYHPSSSEPGGHRFRSLRQLWQIFPTMKWLFSRTPSLRPRHAETPWGRILVVSTPRSGNTWLRRLIATVYELEHDRNEELWAHTPAGFPWGELPRRCVMQLHWEPDATFTRLLREHQVQVVTLARHPLDVLISILQFSQHETESALWVRGKGGNESSLRGASPCSQAFLDYCTGPRASALLSVSIDWWQSRRSTNLRYEDLVRAPQETLAHLTRTIGGTTPAAMDRAVDTCTIDKLRTPYNAPHFWQGKPGLWKKLLTEESARRIADAQPLAFRQFGYRCDPDPELTQEQADANWELLASTVRR